MARPKFIPEVGSIFVTLCDVPAFHIPENLSEEEAKRYITLPSGRVKFEKYMWFVVIKTFPRHCVCLPINTYQGQGTTKPGLRPEDHGIAYDSRGEATLLSGEFPLNAYAVVVSPERRLVDPATRIDFSKPTCFDDYVQKSKIGSIHPLHLQAFKEHFSRVHPASATHEYDYPYTRSSILSTSYNREVVKKCNVSKWRMLAINVFEKPLLAINVSKVPILGIRRKKMHIYIWLRSTCGFWSGNFMSICPRALKGNCTVDEWKYHVLYP